jgi:hypothetical protein
MNGQPRPHARRGRGGRNDDFGELVDGFELVRIEQAPPPPRTGQTLLQDRALIRGEARQCGYRHRQQFEQFTPVHL